MGDEQKYFDFMKSTDYWGIILLIAFFVIIGFVLFFMDFRRRKNFANGVVDVPGKNRTYITPATPEVIEITLGEGVNEDVIIYGFEKEEYPYIVCYKIAKKWQFSKPAVFFINYLPKIDERTVFELVAYEKTDGSRYMPYLDEFVAKKVNGIRVDPDKIYIQK